MDEKTASSYAEDDEVIDGGIEYGGSSTEEGRVGGERRCSLMEDRGMMEERRCSEWLLIELYRGAAKHSTKQPMTP